MAIIKDLSPKHIGLKGQLYIAQGNALGKNELRDLRPVRATIFSVRILYLSFIAAPIGRKLFNRQIPRALPWAME